MIGLLGDVRVLDEARIGAGLRIERCDNFALGGKGTARGEGVCECRFKKSCDDWRFGGDRGEGDKGDLGDGLGDLDLTNRNFDGERDKDRRKDLTADDTSKESM